MPGGKLGAATYVLLLALTLVGIALVGCATRSAAWPHPFTPTVFSDPCDDGCSV